MKKVQATLEFSLHFNQFQGLLPLKTGYYRIWASFSIPRSIPHSMEARIYRTSDGSEQPASISENVLRSCVFKIVDFEQGVRIDDVGIFSIIALLDESKIEETLNALEGKLIFNIYFRQRYLEFKNFEDMDLICSQEATVRFNLHGGIHTHMNVVFDNFSQLSFTIHGLLVVLQPALRSFPDKSSLFKKILPNWWTKTNVPTLESVIFGKAIKKKLAVDGKSSVIEGKYLQHAYRFLSALRSCLLLSYDGFYSYFSSVSETLPSPCKLELENLNMKARLSDLHDKVTEIEDPGDLAEAINASLLELSGELLNLWGTFLQFSLKREMEAFIEEKAREEKIGKLFFSTQHPRQGALTYDEKITQSHKWIYKEVKNSPRDSCSLECPGMDCVVRSPPVIFEDRYLDPNEGLQPICDGDTLIQVLFQNKGEVINREPIWVRYIHPANVSPPAGKQIQEDFRFPQVARPPVQKKDLEKRSSEDDGTHLIVCAHGLGGSHFDLMLVRHYIEAGVTDRDVDFLMSKSNMGPFSFWNIDYLAKNLLNEILNHIEIKKLTVSRISFIGFSLGNIIIRAVLCRPEFEAYLGKLHTFLSFGGPHMGVLYNSSTLLKIGLRCIQLQKSNVSVLQLGFRDHKDPRKTFLYQLSQKAGLEYFRNVVLVGSLQDKMVPYHSARMEMCKGALKSNTLGTVYSEMVRNVLEPVLKNKNCNFVRYDIALDQPNTFKSFIGTAGHTAMITSWQFLEQFFLNAALDYFE
ncbi:protein FAM135A-like [Xenopus tropicalis]|nr:protein FAM135A-like [Xenopus tropicalis]